MSAMRCYNPTCRAEIEPPSGRRRYCPRCGAQQVYECIACRARPGGLIRVDIDADCPRCGAVYARCAACFHPVLLTLGQPLTCPEGCEAGLAEARTGAHDYLANVQRTGAVMCRPADDAPAEPVVWEADEAVSPPVCRFGRVFFATRRGTVRALDEDTGRDLETWTQSPLFSPDRVPLHTAQLQVSCRHVYLCADGGVHAVSVVDGRRAFSLPVEWGDARAAVLGDHLVVCGTQGRDVLCMAMYDTVALCRGEAGLLWERALPPAAAQARQPVVAPGGMNDAFFLRDMSGNILRIPLDGEEESATLWTNEGFGYVSAPAMRGERGYSLAHDSARGAALISFHATEGAVTAVRLRDLAPAYIGVRVSAGCVYLLSDGRDFCELSAAHLNAPPARVFLGFDMTGDMVMETLIILESRDEAGAWLVSLAGTPGDLRPMMVHTRTQERPDLQRPGRGRVALTASDRHIIVTGLDTGRMLAHVVPRPGDAG